VHRVSKQELPTLAKNRLLLSYKEISQVSIKERLEKVVQVQGSYPSLRKYVIDME
jgi:hypothetical protein